MLRQVCPAMLVAIHNGALTVFGCCPVRSFSGQEGRGLSQCGHFSDKGGEGQFFAILCGRLLWTAPNGKYFSGFSVFY